MFAVLKTGGKQYKVAVGDTLRVERLAAEAGDTVQFNEVLMVDGEVGVPLIAGAAVQATVIDQIKGEKLIHFVRRRRKHSSKRTKGHRQQLTLIRVTDIMASGGDATGAKAAIGSGSREARADEAATGGPSAQSAPAKRSRAAKPAAAEPVASEGGLGAAVVGAVGGVIEAAAAAAVDAIIHPGEEQAAPAADTTKE